MTSHPLISVVLLNWNRLEDTKRSLDSVLRQTYPNLEIIVIDNHSDEPGSESLQALYPMIRFYAMEKNYGCPGGRNIAISLAKGDYLFFVDNDGVLESHAIFNAYQIFRENDNIGIVSGRIIFFKEESEIDPNISFENAMCYYYSSFSGGVSMHKKSIYEPIGMYNADFMYGGEETNLSLRLLTINQYVVYSDQVVLWHKRSDTARPKQFNFISACSNMYHTYMQLMPFEFRILFFFHFLFIYPVYAWKNGYFTAFLKAMPSIYKRKLMPNTSGKEIRLKRKQAYLFRKLAQKRYRVFNELETVAQNYTYWKYLRSLAA